MPSKNLKAPFVESAAAISGKLTEYWDTQAVGLCLRISPKGLKTWAYRYRSPLDKKYRRATLGKVPIMTLKAARDMAAKYKAMISERLDPVVEREKAITAESARVDAERLALELEANRKSLKEVGEYYYRECDAGRQTPNAKAPKRKSTLRVERPYFDKMIIPVLGESKIQDLTRYQIEKFINDLTDNKSPSAGRHCRVILHSIFEFAIWKELADKNPCKFLSKPPVKSRDRYLNDAELKAMWETFTLPITTTDLKVSPSIAYAIKIATVTLQRRSEVSGMRLNELDLENKLWNLPSSRTKNGREHVVPLSDLAVELIQCALAVRSKESGFVFPSPRASTDNDKPIDGQAITHAFLRARTVLEWDSIRPHDLRRTGATNLTGEALGFPRFTVSKVLNHTSDTGGASAITGTYDRNEYLPEKRRALDAWAMRLLEIVEGRERAETVVALRG